MRLFFAPTNQYTGAQLQRACFLLPGGLLSPKSDPAE